MKILIMWAILLTIISISWAIYVFYYDRKSKVKFDIDYNPNFLSLNFIKKGHRMTPAHNFSIINTGREKIIIRSIAFQMNVFKHTHYSPISKFLGNLVVLEPKNEYIYIVDHDSEEFGNLFKECNAKKFRVIVESTTRNKYVSKWVRVQSSD